MMVNTTGALLSFSAENVRSFREEATLSMVATRIAEADVPRRVEWGERSSDEVLPAAGLFGGNATGKSNLLRAMDDMRWLVLGSFRSGSPGSGIRRHPFRLDVAAASTPSSFDIDIVVGGRRVQYGFDIDDERVVGEYAYHFPKGRQALLFERDGVELTLGQSMRREARAIEPLLRDNALVMSIAGAVKDSALLPVFEWFGRNLWFADVSTRALRTAYTAQLLDDPIQSRRVLELLRAADLGIEGVRLHSPDEETMDRLRRAVRVLNGVEGDGIEEADDEFHLAGDIRLTHCGPDGCVEFESADESRGTLVWVGFVGPVIDALDRGLVLLADELDASLHPHLVHQIVRLFQSRETNPRCAQLVFNAHDTTILGGAAPRLLGRDQMWFTEKGSDGATSLYPLSDFSPRRDDSIESRYLRGSYGAVPRVHEPSFVRALQVN